MAEIIKLLEEYSERHNIQTDIRFILDQNGTGEVECFYDNITYFEFSTEEEFLTKIKS